MNRGVAKRTVIETRRDAEQFLEGVQRVVDDGLLEVHAYCLMTTHFHMLVRSPVGELSEAMMLIQNLHARGFNRGRKRDGPLWRGRFLSKIIRNDAYWRTVVRYIDHNPVKACMVPYPPQFEFGSARHYSWTREGPPWLCREKIEGIVRTQLARTSYEPRDYRLVFGRALSPSEHWMLERHAFSRANPEDVFADLVAASPERVREWMRSKAQRADGTPEIGVGVLDPDVLLAAIRAAEAAEPDWWIRPGTRRRSGWEALRCALLYQVSGCTIDDVARRVGVGSSTAGRYLKEHAGLVLDDAGYAQRASDVLARLFRTEYGGGA